MSEFRDYMRTYAQDHYWEHWGWDVLLAWTDAELDAALVGAKTKRGAVAVSYRAVRTANNPRDIGRYGVKPVKPVSLFDVLAAAGGLAPHAELRAILDGPVWVGGYGPLVRQRGMDLDEARRVAVERGYLLDTGWGGGVATSVVRDLLDAISDEARGFKVYPYGERGEDPAIFAEDDPANYAEESCYDEIPF